jgi:hypothetical protein
MIDGLLIGAAGRIHGKHPGHRAFHEIPQAHVRTIQIFKRGFGIETDYQVISIHSATHIAGDHEGESTEHRLFNDVMTVR